MAIVGRPTGARCFIIVLPRFVEHGRFRPPWSMDGRATGFGRMMVPQKPMNLYHGLRKSKCHAACHLLRPSSRSTLSPAMARSPAPRPSWASRRVRSAIRFENWRTLRGSTAAAAESRDRDNTCRRAAQARACSSTRRAWCTGCPGTAAPKSRDVTCRRKLCAGHVVAGPPAAGLCVATSVHQRRSQAIGDCGKLKASVRRANCLERHRRRTADVDSIAVVLGADFSRLCAALVASTASLEGPQRPAGFAAHSQGRQWDRRLGMAYLVQASGFAEIGCCRRQRDTGRHRNVHVGCDRGSRCDPWALTSCRGCGVFWTPRVRTSELPHRRVHENSGCAVAGSFDRRSQRRIVRELAR